MEPQTAGDVFDFLTAGAALAGMLIGFFNLWLYFDQKRVKLRVSPMWGYPFGTTGLPDKMLGVEVINLSSFPVTVKQVGYKIPWSKKTMAFVDPILLDHKPWPRRLEPREAVTVYSNPSGILERLGKSYAWTACNVTRTGKRPHW